MRSSRRALIGVAILGLLLALLVILQRRDEGPVAAEIAAISHQSIATARATQQAEPAAASAAAKADPGDESVTKCVQTISDIANFARKERNATPVHDRNSDGDRLVAELAAAQRKLEGSRDPEHFLAAQLLELPERRTYDDSAAQTRLLELGERAAGSGSKLQAWHALRACAEAKQYCPFAHLEQRLLEADRQNAEAWVMVATVRYQRGDVAGALAAMQGAARAPTSTWYWTETIALIERSLAAETPMPYYPDRMVNAFGLGAALLPPTTVYNMCKVESAANRAWGEACLAFGKLRGEHNETDAARLMAYPIREQALTALGDRAGAEQSAAELALVRAERSGMGQEPASSMQELQWDLIGTDPSRFHAYLGAIQQSGEVAGARMFLRQEVPPLLERAGLLEQDGARECVAQFFGPRVAVDTRSASAGHRIQVADELYITMRSTSGEGWNRSLRVGKDGMIRISRTSEFEATGKTTAELQREIATTISGRYKSPQVLVIRIPALSREELRRAFDNARTESVQGRSNSR